jgi:RsiW-degrading membrane proteinase PrsW (M82 family)
MLFMPGVGVLIILLFISSIPAIAVFLWFRLAHYPFSLRRFSFALLAGTTSFFPALFLQNIFPAGNEIFHALGKWSLVAEIFVRIAFTEEFSRLIILGILFFVIYRLFSTNAIPDTDVSSVTIASATGLIAGLGFAILESAVYGASDPGNALLRIFTAVPLHGACGSRVGIAAITLPERPFPAIFRFLTAVAIHGIYNFMLIIPGIIPSVAAVLIALSALASSIVAIRAGMKGESSSSAAHTQT